MRQTTGEDEAVKGDGIKEDTKEEWLREPETWTMPVSTVDK